MWPHPVISHFHTVSPVHLLILNYIKTANLIQWQMAVKIHLLHLTILCIIFQHLIRVCLGIAAIDNASTWGCHIWVHLAVSVLRIYLYMDLPPLVCFISSIKLIIFKKGKNGVISFFQIQRDYFLTHFKIYFSLETHEIENCFYSKTE